MTTYPVPFSARHQGPRRQIDASFPKSGRIGLLHLLHTLVDREYVASWQTVARELRRIGRLEPLVFGYEERMRAKADAEEALHGLSWDRVFDFCERLHQYLAVEVTAPDGEWGMPRLVTSRADVQQFIKEELQRLFVEECLAFEFGDGIVRRRGRRHTVDQVAKAEVVLGDVRLANARNHYEKALQFFRDPSKPDYENSVKEAVCAVEAAGKALFPDANAATLGDLIKWLTSHAEIRLPKALGQTLAGLYGYRSGGDGVGHGGTSGGRATAEVAEYALALSASQIIYLVALATIQDTEVPF